MIFKLPFKYGSKVTRHFGPVWSGSEFEDDHLGIDWRKPEGSRVHCPADGVVSLVTENEDAAGYSVWIQHGEHGAVMSVSCHLMERSPLEVGEEVLQGQLIGLVGDTGNSFGSHLHFETMVCGEHYNPVTVSKKWDTYFSVDWPSNANTQEELNGRDISE